MTYKNASLLRPDYALNISTLTFESNKAPMCCSRFIASKIANGLNGDNSHHSELFYNIHSDGVIKLNWHFIVKVCLFQEITLPSNVKN
jgi:hypothetical protein